MYHITYINALKHTCVVRGVFVGGREMMLEMIKSLEDSGTRPVVDEKVFGFEELKEVLRYQVEQKHVGKVVLDYQPKR